MTNNNVKTPKGTKAPHCRLETQIRWYIKIIIQSFTLQFISMHQRIRYTLSGASAACINTNGDTGHILPQRMYLIRKIDSFYAKEGEYLIAQRDLNEVSFLLPHHFCSFEFSSLILEKTCNS